VRHRPLAKGGQRPEHAARGLLAGAAWQARLDVVPRRRPGALDAGCAPGNCPPAIDGNDRPSASNPTCAPSYAPPTPAA
jgi:hypothetical protein